MTKIENILTKITFGLMLGVIFFFSINQLNQSDIFYHIKTGEVIWQLKEIPQKDIFSYTAYGKPWVPHEWLAQLIFFGIYNFSGFWGIMIFSSLLALITYLLVFKLARYKGADFFPTVLILSVIALFNSWFWVPRPQSLSYLFFAIVFYLMELFHKKNDLRYLFGVILTIIFWANINASFILGIAVIFAYFLASVTKKILPKIFGVNESKKEFKFLGLAFLGSILGALINPVGFKVFLYSYTIGPAVKLLKINEWKPIYSFLNNPRYLVSMIVIIIVLGLFIWQAIKAKKTTSFGFWLVGIGVSLLPFISVRHLGFWPIAAASGIVILFSKYAKNLFEKISIKVIAIFFISIFSFLIFFRAYAFPKNLWNFISTPSTTVDFMIENKIKGPIFNLYNEGMYLIFRLWPNEKVFIDGRSEIYDMNALNDFFKIIRADSDWNMLVDEKYKINCFFLPYYPENLIKSIEPLFKKLSADKENWALIYFDDGAALFLRKNAENAKFIKIHEYKVISPYRDPRNILSGEKKDAEAELNRLLMEAPSSALIQQYAKVYILSQQGN